jgi:NADH:ubiquinone oxidoreductase subunit K
VSTWLWVIGALPFATALVLVFFGSRFTRGPGTTVAGVLSLFLLAVPAGVAVVVALVLKICRRFKAVAVSAIGEMRG